MFTLFRKLHRTRLLTLPGLYHLLRSVISVGANPMTMLRLAAQLHPERIAIVDENEQLTYTDLWHQAESLAGTLHAECGIRPAQKVAIACRNHAAVVKAIFAFSRLGSHVFLVNPEMSHDQLHALEQHRRFDFYIYDEPLAPVFAESPLKDKSLPSYHSSEASVDRLARRPCDPPVRLKKVKAGNIVVMTGGTTGQPKAASRNPSIVDFLPPFAALLTRIHLDNYRNVCIATPIYHGFGLAALFIGVMLGTEMYLLHRFDAGRACELIARHQIEAVTVVPLMLQRMLDRDAAALTSLRCVIAGGAMLSPLLARDTLKQLGPVLFNLYGTSEGGFAIMATPESLVRKPESIGQPVRGVTARIVDESDREVSRNSVGRLRLRSSWTISKKDWIETGDLAYRDADGDIFLCGRIDDMIVSGGENVYPIELENVLAQHPDIATAAVIGIPDAEFGQRLKAFVVARQGRSLNQSDLQAWLRSRVARHQMPAVIEFRDELPCTSLGKLNKKALKPQGT